MRLVNLDELNRIVRSTKKGLLGFDVGVKHAGLAVSDPDCRIAIPLCVLQLKQSDFDSNVQKLHYLAKKYRVAGFVIGYPLDLAGLRNGQSVTVDDFVTKLRKTGKFANLCYFLEDERFTSMMVRSVMEDYTFQIHEHKGIVDKFSAVNILQVCLDRLSRYYIGEQLMKKPQMQDK